jgi:phosphatidylinositol 4-kinase
MQVKDRHNANILIDRDGSLVHIDFGFILGESPGFNIGFEMAAFKLTSEYVEVLGGIDSAAFKMFEDLFIRGFMALQKHVDSIYSIVQLFYGRKRGPADALKARLLYARSQTDISRLIYDSVDHWCTKQYDWYQQSRNNIKM